MRAYSLGHLSDRELGCGLASLVAQERSTTATLLAHLAEFDARRLYLPAAYPSMYAYCVHELRLSEDAAYKRIQAARVARRFPAIFELLADGRLHLTTVLLLASYLTAENAEELLAAAAHKTKAEIERLLAERFPRPDVPARIEVVSAAPSPLSLCAQLAPERVAPLAPERVEPPGPGPVAAPARPPKVAPLSPQRYALQLTIAQETYDDLRYAQALLGHQVPSGDVAQVFGRALKALIRQLEKTKFAATRSPRRTRPAKTVGKRHIPAHVKRAVWERDGGQCTFVSEAGRRCPARKRLEFDHVDAVARGGRGGDPTQMPRPQSVRSRVHVRSGVHAPQTPRGAAGSGNSAPGGGDANRGRGAAPGGGIPGAGRRRGGDQAAPFAGVPRRGGASRGRALRDHPRGLARKARTPSALLFPAAAQVDCEFCVQPGKRAMT